MSGEILRDYCLPEETESEHQKEVHVNGENAVLEVNSFDDPRLNLNEILLKNIKSLGFEEPTKVQGYTMPQMLAGLDVMSCSNTGTGKTAAYLIPIIQLISAEVNNEKNKPKQPLSKLLEFAEERPKTISSPAALILAPTRELVEQICRDARLLATDLPVMFLPIYGGDSLGRELRRLRSGNINVVVATPGRLNHILAEFSAISLNEAKYLVVDEADEMFNRGFFEQIREIINLNMKPKEDRVNVMFSATFPLQIRYFARKKLRPEHVFISVGILGGASMDVIQDVRSVSNVEKDFKLMSVLQEFEGKKILVFCNTIERASATVRFLRMKDQSPGVLFSELSQCERDEALMDFHLGKTNILVATSLASRGLNIKNVMLVINYDLPKDGFDYVQRIGRTRPSNKADIGVAISFLDPDTDEAALDYIKFALGSVHQDIPEFLNILENQKKRAENDLKDHLYPGADIQHQILTNKPTFLKKFECNDESDWFG